MITLTQLKRHVPTILSGLSIVGLIATTALAIKATPKAQKKIDKEIDRKNREALQLAIKNEQENLSQIRKLEPVETIKLVWRDYIPTIVVGLVTTVCIISTNVINQKSQARLMSAYGLLDQSYKKYRSAADRVFGDGADEKIISEVAKNQYISADGFAIYDGEDDSSEKVLFYDSYSNRYFHATMAAVINAQYHINRNLTLRGDVSVNEFYKFLGIKGVDGGEEIGWNIEDLFEDEIAWLDFKNHKTVLDDGLVCYIVSPIFNPVLLAYD